MVWSAVGRIDSAWMPYLVAFAATWTTLTTFSRLYMGVHTPADLVTGCLLGFTILAGGILLSDWMDYFLLLSPWAPASVLLGLPAALYLYPRQAQWTNSLGDTTVVTSASLGVVLTSWMQPAAHMAACAAPIQPLSAYRLMANMPAYLLCCIIVIGGRSAAKAVVLPAWRHAVSSALYRLLLHGESAAAVTKSQPLSGVQIAAKRELEEAEGADRDTLKLTIEPKHSADPEVRSVLSSGSLVDPSTPSSDTEGLVAERTGKQLPRSPLMKRAPTKKQPVVQGEPADLATPQLRMADEGEQDADTIALQHRTSPGAQYGFRYDVEVPVKMVVYCLIGVNVNLTSLVLLQWLGVQDYGLQLPAVLLA